MTLDITASLLLALIVGNRSNLEIDDTKLHNFKTCFEKTCKEFGITAQLNFTFPKDDNYACWQINYTQDNGYYLPRKTCTAQKVEQLIYQLKLNLNKVSPDINFETFIEKVNKEFTQSD